MNTDKLITILDDYLQLLQSQDDADDDKITDVKMMIWAIQKDLKTQRWLNNLVVSNQYYKR